MKNESGFTLIELLITIVIAAVLLTLAAPSFQNSIQRSRAATQANEILAALNFARSEAVKLSRDVFICPRKSADSLDCGGATDWVNGWIVEASGGAEPLRIGEPLRAGTTFNGSEALVTFEASGGASFSSGADQSTWTMTVESEQKTIRINRLGRASVDAH